MLRKMIEVKGCYDCVLVKDGVCPHSNKNVQAVIDAHVGYHEGCCLNVPIMAPTCFADVRHHEGTEDGDIKRCNNHECNYFLQGEQGFSRKWPSRCSRFHKDEDLRCAGGGKFKTLYWRWSECLAETGDEEKDGESQS